MSEIVKRVAEALKLKRAEKIAQPLSSLYEDMAKAAIEAMREPTEQMIDDGSWVEATGEIVGKYAAKECWHEMIDAALK